MRRVRCIAVSRGETFRLSAYFLGALILALLLSALGLTASRVRSQGLNQIPFEVHITLPSAKIQFASPTLGDLDGDDIPEIVVGTSDGRVYALKANRYEGTVLWWRDTASAINAVAPGATATTIRTAITIADLDRDGSNEVIVPVGEIFQAGENGGMVVYGHDGQLEAGWPRLTYDRQALGHTAGIASTPAVADLDADGDLEVISGAFDNRVYAWHHDGTLVSGWPRHVFDTVWSSPAVGDIDNDGLIEVVIGTDSHLDPYFGTINGGALHVFKPDGSEAPGFPRYVNENIMSTPALADLNGDGYLNIIIGGGSYWGGSDGHKVHVYSHTGAYLPGWPAATGDNVTGSPAVADIDGNGDLEVVVGSWDRKVYAWHHDGAVVAGWPAYPKQYWQGNTVQQRTAVVVDVDRLQNPDGRPEVLVSNGWEVSILNSHGQQLTWDGAGDNPASLPTYLTSWTLDASPAVGDVDGDGRLELVAGGAGAGGSSGGVYVWELGASQVSTSGSQWPMYKRSTSRSGLLATTRPNDATVISHNIPEHLLPGEIVRVDVTLRNVGTATWRSASGHGLGALFSTNEAFGLPSRLALPQDVSTGGETTFVLELTAPIVEGYHPLELRLVQEGVEWYGARISRDIRVGNTPGFHVLHTSNGGPGGVVPEGVAQQIAPPAFSSWGNTRAFAVKADGAGYYLLDGVGADVYWAGTARDVGSIGTAPAVDLELSPDGQGYYLIDAYGRISHSSSAPSISPPPPAFGDQRIRSFAVVDGSRVGAYVLDGYGNVYVSGGLSSVSPPTPVFGAPVAKRIQATDDGSGYYVLDAYGRVHNGGSAPPIVANYAPHLGEDWARDFELTDDGQGYYLLDRNGDIHTGGTAVAYPERNPIAQGMGQPVDLEVFESRVRAVGFGVAGVDDNSNWLTAPGEPELPSVVLTLQNVGGGGQVAWSSDVTAGASWLELTPDAGATPQQVTMRVSQLPPLGQHEGTVVLHASNQQLGYETDVTLNVRLVVAEQIARVYLPLEAR